MSIQTEISRIQGARDTLRSKAIELGIAQENAKLDTLATAFENITNNGSVSATVQEGDTYTIPKGYHDGSGTVSGVAGGGNYTLQSKKVTPSKQQMPVTADSGYYGLSDVTVEAIPVQYQDVSSVTATASDVLATKTIVTSDGTVTPGTMPNNGTVSETLSGSKTSVTIAKGYHSGTGKVSIVTETKAATPTKSSQTITPTSGKVLTSVTVAAIPENFIDTSSATAVAGDILDGKTAFVDGVEVEGTMPNNGAINKTIDGLVTTSASISAGYTSGGTISLDSSIEDALIAI